MPLTIRSKTLFVVREFREIARFQTKNLHFSLTSPEHHRKNMSDQPPLITHLFTADPSAHVFNNKLFLYASRETDAAANSLHGATT